MDIHSPPRKRRPSRGRRSLITIQSEGASPTVVNAPVNSSIQGNTTQERIAEVKERIKILHEYKAKLQEEQLAWDTLTNKYTEKANKKDDNLAPVSQRKLDRQLDDCGVRPNYLLSRVFNEFQDSMGKNALQQKNVVSKLRKALSAKEEKLEEQEKSKKRMVSIYKQAELDDLTKKINLWKNVMAVSTQSIQETTMFMSTLKCV